MKLPYPKHNFKISAAMSSNEFTDVKPRRASFQRTSSLSPSSLPLTTSPPSSLKQRVAGPTIISGTNGGGGGGNAAKPIIFEKIQIAVKATNVIGNSTSSFVNVVGRVDATTIIPTENRDGIQKKQQQQLKAPAVAGGVPPSSVTTIENEGGKIQLTQEPHLNYPNKPIIKSTPAVSQGQGQSLSSKSPSKTAAAAESESAAIDPLISIEGKLKSYGPYIRIYQKSPNLNFQQDGVLGQQQENHHRRGGGNHYQFQQNHHHHHPFTPVNTSANTTSSFSQAPSSKSSSHRNNNTTLNSNMLTRPSTSISARGGGSSNGIAGKYYSKSVSSSSSNNGRGIGISDELRNSMDRDLDQGSITSSGRARLNNIRGETNSALSFTRNSFSQQPPMVDPALPLLPFLSMTNALHLHIHLNILQEKEEKIVSWTPGSFVVQAFPFIPEEGARRKAGTVGGGAGLFSLISLFNPRVPGKEDNLSNSQTVKFPPLTFPGYLLVSSKAIYILRPLFRISSLRWPGFYLLDTDGTSYGGGKLTPSKMVSVSHRMTISELERIDVGGGRQYLGFHSGGVVSTSKGGGGGKDITSIVFETSSRSVCEGILEGIVSSLQEIMRSPSPSPTSSPTRNGADSRRRPPSNMMIRKLINQDVEWTYRNILDNVLLRAGDDRDKDKNVAILNSWKVWPPPKTPTHSSSSPRLSPNEFDPSITFPLTRTEFSFVKCLVSCVYLRYIRPLSNIPVPVDGASPVGGRSVEIHPITLLATETYLYALQERRDIWPPSHLLPSTSSSTSTSNSTAKEDKSKKGLLSDRIPQFSMMGVGRISEVCRIERWRSWRIDGSLQNGEEEVFTGSSTSLLGGSPSDFKGLGQALQNGHVGYLTSQTQPTAGGGHQHVRQQQGSSLGYIWWVRVYFGGFKGEEDVKEGIPAGGPSAPPVEPRKPLSPPSFKSNSLAHIDGGYFWDLSFSCRETSTEFLDTFRSITSNVQIIMGDE